MRSGYWRASNGQDGDDGRAYLPFSHADILFKEDGEVEHRKMTDEQLADAIEIMRLRIQDAERGGRATTGLLFESRELENILNSRLRRRAFEKKRTGYEKGFWKDAQGKIHEIKKMDTSHIENCVAYLNRKIDETPMSPDEHDFEYTESPDAEKWIEKRAEFRAELDRRAAAGERVEITKVRVEVTESDFIEFAKRHLGIKIPKSGAGVYIEAGVCEPKIRMTQAKVTIEFDKQRKLRKRVSARSFSRRSLTTGKKGSKRRS